MKIAMNVIPEPAPGWPVRHPSLHLGAEHVPVTGARPDCWDLACGVCGQVLKPGAQSLTEVSGIVMQCPKCLSFNEIRLFTGHHVD